MGNSAKRIHKKLVVWLGFHIIIGGRVLPGVKLYSSNVYEDLILLATALFSGCGINGSYLSHIRAYRQS